MSLKNSIIPLGECGFQCCYSSHRSEIFVESHQHLHLDRGILGVRKGLLRLMRLQQIPGQNPVCVLVATGVVEQGVDIDAYFRPIP